MIVRAKVPIKQTLLLIFLLICIVLVSCDNPEGLTFTYRNDTGSRVHMYIDLIPEGYVDDTGELNKPFLEYRSSGGSFDPGQIIRREKVDADKLPPSTFFVVTAVSTDGEIVFQEVYSVQELSIPEMVVVMVDQRND